MHQEVDGVDEGGEDCEEQQDHEASAPLGSLALPDFGRIPQLIFEVGDAEDVV